MPEVAEVAACAIQDGRKDYDLHSWVVMPNHVHVLITPWNDVSNVMRRIKGGTAREANRQLHQVGRPFWQHESYDRLVRDGQEFRRIERYILLNPVRAGLAPRPELYRWSSAWAG
jgi:REP element-mobilizing transposase RayT